MECRRNRGARAARPRSLQCRPRPAGAMGFPPRWPWRGCSRSARVTVRGRTSHVAMRRRRAGACSFAVERPAHAVQLRPHQIHFGEFRFGQVSVAPSLRRGCREARHGPPAYRTLPRSDPRWRSRPGGFAFSRVSGENRTRHPCLTKLRQGEVRAAAEVRGYEVRIPQVGRGKRSCRHCGT